MKSLLHPGRTVALVFLFAILCGTALLSLPIAHASGETGPLLTGLVLAGRVGAKMTAEIATMRVTEQIDALSTLATDPYKYLVAPRLIAGLKAGQLDAAVIALESDLPELTAMRDAYRQRRLRASGDALKSGFCRADS